VSPPVIKSHPDAIPTKGDDRERQVRRIFSEIAPRYYLLNPVLSLNIDRRWRTRAVDRLGWERAPGGVYLDACAGTFDLSLELARRPGFRGTVIASDFAYPMLSEGKGKLTGVNVASLCGDSLRLPFTDGTFRGATVGFGVRNLAHLEQGLGELHRVLAPGARLVVLEFTIPPNPLVRAGYLLYFNRVLPVVGRVVSGHPWAYTYLPESVKEFPGPEGLERRFAAAGFQDTGYQLLSFGIAALHWGTK
jgi:demethylmenaquinone methyltransferase/2-methoxy-6-polyprenyl-1,4-benzoquinol methylase